MVLYIKKNLLFGGEVCKKWEDQNTDSDIEMSVYPKYGKIKNMLFVSRF